jgi:hypothetical protein
MRIFIAGSEFLCSRKSDAALLAARRDLPDAVDEVGPRLPVRRLERIVVALDPGPQDHLRADGRREVGGAERLIQGCAPDLRVRGRERSSAEAGVQVRPGRDRVDAVLPEHGAHLLEVVLRELLRVVELVVVDEIAETLDRASDALGHRLAGPLRLVAARNEARDHRP